MAPPYLASTMPYPRVEAGHAGAARRSRSPTTTATTSPRPTRSSIIKRRRSRTCCASRIPRSRDRTYGQALIDALDRAGSCPKAASACSRSAPGLGYVAQRRDRAAARAGHEVEYTIVELAPALAAAQKERLGGDATWMIGDVLTAQVARRARSTSSSATRWSATCRRASSRASTSASTLDGTGTPISSACACSRRSPPTPVQPRRRARAVLPADRRVRADRDGSRAGSRPAAPRSSPSSAMSRRGRGCRPTSIIRSCRRTSATCQQVARASGLDRADRVRDRPARLRSHAARPRDHAQSLPRAARARRRRRRSTSPKIGYTPALLAHTVAGKLDLAQVGELRWDRIEDRLMGLVPHEFKALLMHRPR